MRDTESSTRSAIYSESVLHARLSHFEAEFGKGSEEFLAEWERGDLPATDEYFAWAGLCNRLGVRERELA